MRYDRAESPFALTPWVKGLIIANAVVFLLTITVFTGEWFRDWFAFQPHRLPGRWWTAATYMFVHGGFLHLAFNMLMLFFFGPAVEERMGSRGFALYYLTCGLGGAALSVAMLFTTPAPMILGSSAAIFGVALAFALNWPDARIFVFPLPVPIKAIWLVIFLAAVNLFAAIIGTRNGVAHLAHLGGFLFGFIYLKSEQAVVRRARAAVRRGTETRVIPHPRARRAAKAPAASSEPSPKEQMADRIDRVLDKISATGIDSLTPDERRLLDEMSRELRNH